MKLTLAVLAAGCSKRYGSPKLLQKIDDRTILEKSLENISFLIEKLPEVEFSKVLILGSYRDTIIKSTDGKLIEKFTILENKHWENGISSSLNLAASHSISVLSDGMMLFFADMPLISYVFTMKVIEIVSQNREKIIRPVFGEIPGFPVYFHKRFLKEFLKLSGNNGARQIIAENRDSFLPIITNYEFCTLDVDTVDDLKQIKNLAFESNV